MELQDVRLAYVENMLVSSFRRIFSGFYRERDGSTRLRAGSQGKHGDFGHISISFRVIESVTNDKFVRNRESNVVRVDRRDAALWLVKQYRDADTLRLALFKHAQQIL